MDAKQGVRNFVNTRIMEPRLKISESWEQKVRDYPGAYKGRETSPLRFKVHNFLRIQVSASFRKFPTVLIVVFFDHRYYLGLKLIRRNSKGNPGTTT